MESRSSAYRPELSAVRSAQAAVRLGTLAWILAGLVGVPVLVVRDAGASWWLLTCAIGIVSGLFGLLYLRAKARYQEGL